MEDFVTYEVAKKLEAKGFNVPCINAINRFKCTYRNGWCEYLDDRYEEFITRENLKPGDVLLPLIHQVLKWLRKEKGIFIEIEYINRKTYGCTIIEQKDGGVIAAWDWDKFQYANKNPLTRNTYEETALAGIEYVLDNLIEDYKNL